jgi:hypothetical protein
MLSIREVHLYNKFVTNGDLPPINCPFNEHDANHIIISFIDENDSVYFECLTCNTKFKPGLETIEKIRSGLDKLLNN